MKKIMVAGATGGLGSAIVLVCAAQNRAVIAFARSEKKLIDMFGHLDHVTCIAGDVRSEQDVLKATEDAELIINAVNFPYPEWEKTQMKSLKNLLRAAKKWTIPFVMLDNIYAYGKGQSEVSEKSAKNTETKKGKIRVEMANAIEQSGVNYIHCHIPDIYGPHAVNSLIYMMLDGVIREKQAIYMGKPDTIREYAYTPDIARTVLALSDRQSAYNQTWNIAGGMRLNGYELHAMFSTQFGYKKTFLYISHLKLTLLGIVSKLMREVKELFYLYDEPIHLDDKKLKDELGNLVLTDIEESIEITYNWIKQHHKQKHK